MPKKGGKKKKKLAAADHALVKLLPQLKEAERKCRAKFESVSGFQISRPREDEETFGELIAQLTVVEEQVSQLLDGLSQSEVGELVTWIIPLLDAGCVDFLAGSRRQEGLLVCTAARKALCRKEVWDEDEDDDDDERSDRTDSPRDENASEAGQRPSTDASTYTVGNLVAAYADAGLIALRRQLWRPSRDGNHQALAALLALDPWTIDEPGRVGEGFTNALQVACAAGHVECVELLLKHGAIFRDKDWQPTPRPFVCASMLTGAGYYDVGGGGPKGVLYFQSSSLPKRRVARETYVHIIDCLLEQATFCEGEDREMLNNTRFALLNVDPPPLAADSKTVVVPPYVPPKPATPPPEPAAPVSSATPRYMARTGNVASATPREGRGVGGATPRNSSPLGRGVSSPPTRVGGATPRDGGGVGRFTPREHVGVGRFTPREGVGRATPRDRSIGAVSGATPRLGRGVSSPGFASSSSSPGLGRAASGGKVGGATPREGGGKVGGATPRYDSRGHLLQRTGSSLGAAPGLPGVDEPVLRDARNTRVGGATPRDKVGKATPRDVPRPQGLLIAR